MLDNYVNREQILEELITILKNKEGSLSDLTESSYGRTILDLFAGITDVNATMVRQAYNDIWLDTATTTESVISASRMLGYSIRRPIPARGKFTCIASKSGTKSGFKVKVKAGAVTNGPSGPLTLLSDVEFYWDRSFGTDGMMKKSSGNETLYQGLMKSESFVSNQKPNQEFFISDRSASDMFGYGDTFYDGKQSQASYKRSIFKVYSDIGLSDSAPNGDSNIYWRISRRGIFNPYIDELVSTNNKYSMSNNYTCLVSTANDTSLKIEFGDGFNGAIPNGVINVTYFSTLGTVGNQSSVVGSELTFSFNDISITDMQGNFIDDIKASDLKFVLSSDLNGGLLFEDIRSIKNNAPKIFSSLDSLGNDDSYSTYLKRVGLARYGIAYGEDVMQRVLNGDKPDIRFANTIRYSVLKSLYSFIDGNYYPATPNEYYYEGFKVNGLLNTWSYDYTKIKKGTQLYNAINGNMFTRISSADEYIVKDSELEFVHNGLKKKGYLTLGGGANYYVKPSVHEFDVIIDIKTETPSSVNTIKSGMANAIYDYIDKNNDFNKKIYTSTIVNALRDAGFEYDNVNVQFKPKRNEQFASLKYSDIEIMNTSMSYLIQPLNSNKSFAVSINYNGEQSVFTWQTTSVISYLRKVFAAYLVENGGFDSISSEYKLNDFVNFVWSQSIDGGLLSNIQGDYKYGLVKNFSKWTISNGVFSIKGDGFELVDVNGQLYSFVTYIINYIKLIRNIRSSYVAESLIKNGNITEYILPTEICQLFVETSNIRIER